ncbi:MAG: PilZ domain-containing protein [Gammaproteobacteria bacterium]|nr:PilZ domain-containing protein [Gammaproteobacteria bacterium]
MSNDNSDERRRFSRIPFESKAHVNSHNGELYLNCHVIDVSLNGILLKKPDAWLGKMNDQYSIDLLLENAQLVIKMDTDVAHIDKDTVGFRCTHIDLDSITHLKRLVELNLGDEGLLNRELSALIHY